MRCVENEQILISQLKAEFGDSVFVSEGEVSYQYHFILFFRSTLAVR